MDIPKRLISLGAGLTLLVLAAACGEEAGSTVTGPSPLEVLISSTHPIPAVESLRGTIAAEMVSPEESLTWAAEVEMTKEGTMHAALTMSSPDEQWHFELIQTPTHVYMKESDAPWIRTSIETAELPSSTFETDLFQGIFDDHEIPWEVVTVETLGWEEIGGVKAEHLQIQVDLLALMRAQLQEFREEVIGQEVPVDEMFAEILEEQAALLPEFNVEVWVDEQYIARKQSMRMAMGE